MNRVVLVAVDLSEDSHRVIEKAEKFAGSHSALHLVHVVEPITTAYSMDIHAASVSELQQGAIGFAEQKLEQIAQKLAIEADHIHTLIGAPGSEIRNLATELEADAIVIGSHGHSGWKILLGSTAIKVLHGATCDVLTVHVGKDD